MTETNQNMNIWNQASTTDPSITKAGNISGMQVTSIPGIYMAQRATEIFGPIGKGWGYEIIEDKMVETGPIFARDPQGGETSEVLAQGLLHMIKLRLWWRDGQDVHEVYQYGLTPFRYRSKYGFSVDQECHKKTLTDAMKKCLSMLGLSADIFLGYFDDPQYVAEQRLVHDIEKADDKVDALEEKKAEFAEWAKREIKSLSMIPGEQSLRTVHKKQVNHVKGRGKLLGYSQKQVSAMTAKFDEALEAQLKKIAEK